MGTKIEQIENYFAKAKAGIRKWMKNQRNRKIRRVPKDETPNIKYNGWEY